ncbi:MAG TPA: endonuclease/exonuclease/phosphatase family protein [Steroidobacteraceae bacterium]|nr:endonuclease/exonuclease/phosphatase family protein [Steroidobacteraceae bacterium]
MDASLSIASYNVHSCVGTDLRCDVGRVAQVIRELDCDTVGLQEVFGRHGERCDPQQLERLAEETGMNAIPGATLLRPDGHYGNGLLTRRRVLEVRRHDISVPRCEPRGALEADLEVGRHVVRVLVTHLGLRPAERRRQVQQIVEVLSATPPEITLVVLGDMNEWLPTGRPLRWLHDLLEQAPAERSFPVWLPMFALDRIWARPRSALRAFEVHRSPLARRASDHFPVKAVVVPGA